MSRSNVVQLPGLDAAIVRVAQNTAREADEEKRNAAREKRNARRRARREAEREEHYQTEEVWILHARIWTLWDRLYDQAVQEAYELDGFATSGETVKTILCALVKEAWRREMEEQGERAIQSILAGDDCEGGEEERFRAVDVARAVAKLAQQAGHLLPEVQP